MAVSRRILLGAKAGGGGSGPDLFVGTYTGDGNATKAIIGVGFTPAYVMIYRGGQVAGWKTSSDGVNSRVMQNGQVPRYTTDHIISLDADGFTVGDGTAQPYGNVMNVGARVYTYVALA